ncbi:hypothetical protein ACFX13_029894 [Malus domestica]
MRFQADFCWQPGKFRGGVNGNHASISTTSCTLSRQIKCIHDGNHLTSSRKHHAPLMMGLLQSCLFVRKKWNRRR